MRVDLKKVITQFQSRGYQYLNAEVKNELSIQQLINQLTTFYQNYFDKDFIKERIALPPQYEQFLSEFKGSFYSDQWAGFYGIDDLLERTQDWYEYWGFDYATRKEENQLGQDDTMWINFGYWSDKHEMVLCVDKLNPHFGKIIDTRGHPFLHGKIYIDSYYHSFKVYAEDHKETYDY